MRKILKGLKALQCRRYIEALYRGVLPAVEHESLLRELACRFVVDIGANRGQFSVVAERCYPEAQIFAFEPLACASDDFRRLFASRPLVSLYQMAVGPSCSEATIHVAKKDHSSSLLPITAVQTSYFPGTGEKDTKTVQMTTLESIIAEGEVVSPSLLKVDVQGFELETLRGCESLLWKFDYVYVECSFVELYEGQAMADEVIGFLENRGLWLAGVYNMLYSRSDGCAIQGDFLFKRQS